MTAQLQWRNKAYEWRGEIDPPGPWNDYKTCSPKEAEEFMREFEKLEQHRTQFEYRIKPE